jgi:nucleoside-diphosphate-sugar epimerase
VSDVANANIMAATTDIDSQYYGQVFNVGTGINFSIKKIARLISNNFIHLAPRPGEARTSLAINTKLKNVFGWEPKIKLEDWITEQIK